MPEELKRLGSALHDDVAQLRNELREQRQEQRQQQAAQTAAQREDRDEQQKRWRRGLVTALACVALLASLLLFNNYTTRQKASVLCPLLTAAQGAYDPNRRAQLPTEEQRQRYDDWYRELNDTIHKLDCPVSIRAPLSRTPVTETP